jgi:hypothetical protein
VVFCELLQRFHFAKLEEQNRRARIQADRVTLKSALQDLRETTLAAISGLLAKLTYFGSIHRHDGGYKHWGMTLVHGKDASDRALRQAHTETLAKVLRSPISDLEEDLQQSSASVQEPPAAYVEGMREQFDDLLPSPKDPVAARHLNSVLVALSSLEKNRKRATRSASSPLPPPAQ